ncbi:MAG: glycosyltransferase family 2 protein [Bacteroidetes bacterium]|nr:glycosyltransferase family 2 protein [Bacteroidota bacterium]
MEISVIHPSRSRPAMAAEPALKWLDNCRDANNVEYILSLDDSDETAGEYREIFLPFAEKVKIIQQNSTSIVEATNAAALHSSGRILLVSSDDFDCPKHWDELLLTALKDKEDFLVKTNDGLQPFIITLPIMDRAYYNRFGYIFYPGYKHMYCDTEMSCVGHMLERTITLDILFPHRHYTTGAMKRDALNIENDKTMAGGKILFTERKKTNFDIEHPLKSCPL